MSILLVEDLALYTAAGKNGYRDNRLSIISVYHEFTPDKNDVRGGCLDDWTYDFLGMPSLVTELWNVDQAAGVSTEGFYPSNRRKVEDEGKILAFLETPYEKSVFGLGTV